MRNEKLNMYYKLILQEDNRRRNGVNDIINPSIINDYRNELRYIFITDALKEIDTLQAEFVEWSRTYGTKHDMLLADTIRDNVYNNIDGLSLIDAANCILGTKYSEPYYAAAVMPYNPPFTYETGGVLKGYKDEDHRLYKFINYLEDKISFNHKGCEFGCYVFKGKRYSSDKYTYEEAYNDYHGNSNDTVNDDSYDIMSDDDMNDIVARICDKCFPENKDTTLYELCMYIKELYGVKVNVLIRMEDMCDEDVFKRVVDIYKQVVFAINELETLVMKAKLSGNDINSTIADVMKDGFDLDIIADWEEIINEK